MFILHSNNQFLSYRGKHKLQKDYVIIIEYYSMVIMIINKYIIMIN